MTDLIKPTDVLKIAEVDKIEAEHPSVAMIWTHERALASASVQASEAISANCHGDFRAYHKSGTRPLSEIKWIVMHDTEGGTARGIASYFTSLNSGGSAHLVVDDKTCYRCLNDQDVPWGAPGANYKGFHIEQCGYARWTTTLWSKTHRKTLMRAAYKAAYHCRKYGIPVRFCTAVDLKAGRAGITTHLECTKAFGGSHVDPGPGWPRALFMTMVKGYYVTLKIRRVA